MNEKKDNTDLFKEAAEEAFAKMVIEKEKSEELAIIKKEELKEYASDIIDSGLEEWNELSKAISGKFAKKAMNIIEASSDKDFMRIYPKLLEYFKPKMTRVEKGDDDIEDKIITIQIVQITEDGSRRVLTLNKDGIYE